MKLTHRKIAKTLENGGKIILKVFSVQVIPEGASDISIDTVILSIASTGQWFRHYSDGNILPCALSYHWVQSSEWEIVE